MPVFRGLIGPMPEGKGIVRYETPEVFETLTKEWSTAATARSRRRAATAELKPQVVALRRKTSECPTLSEFLRIPLPASHLARVGCCRSSDWPTGSVAAGGSLCSC